MKSLTQFLNEGVEPLDEATIKYRNVVRGGRIIRRQKFSSQPGYTVRGGKLKRLSSSEHRKRVWGAKRGARKRRAKLSQILRKRAYSMRRRKFSFGRY